MKKNKTKLSSKDMQRKLLKIAGVLGVIFLLLGGFTFAKYMNEQSSNNYIGRPEGFYFESDYLSVNNSAHEMQNWNKDKDYNFIIDIRNFQDTLKFAEMDINYTLNITGLDNNSVKATLNNSEVTSANKSFTLTANSANTDSLLVTVPKGQIPNNNQIIITATAQANGSNGYTKELMGTFNLKENVSTFETSLENHRDYYDLLVGVAKNNQTINVDWPSFLTPDTTVTDFKVTDGTNTGSFITSKDDSSIRLRFFVTGVVDKSQKFTISDSTNTQYEELSKAR